MGKSFGSLLGIGPDVNGDAVNFNSGLLRTWTLFLSTDSVIGSFDASLFNVNVAAFNGTAGFTNSLAGGSFGVALGDSNTDVFLRFTPIPEPRAALLGALGALAFLRRRR